MAPQNFSKNLLLLLATILCLFLAGEIFARIYFSKSIATNEALRIYENSDIAGWEHKPNATASHGPGSPPPQVRINNYGMRGPEITKEKPTNTIRVLLLGDSFTFGMITDQEKIFPYLLEQKLNRELSPKTNKKYEVLNFGTVGYTIDQEYLLLREKGLAFKPDMVIVNYFAGNDASEFNRHEWEMANGELKRVIDILHFVDENNELRRRGVGKPTSYFIAFIRERGKVLFDRIGIKMDRPRLLWSNFLAPGHGQGDKKIDEYFEKAKQMLNAIKMLDDKNNIKTLITLIPADFQVNQKYLSKYPGNPFGEAGFDVLKPQNTIATFTEQNNIDTLDLLPLFKKDANDIYFPENDPHFTEYGHQSMAEILFNSVHDEFIRLRPAEAGLRRISYSVHKKFIRNS